MKKYNPSIEGNNELKKDFEDRFNALLYKVDKGQINSHIDKDAIKPIKEALKEAYETLNGVLGTGEENIESLYNQGLKCLKQLDEKFAQELTSQISEAADDLIFVVESWADILNGEVAFIEDNSDVQKKSWAKKRLEGKLAELESIKKELDKNDKRLEIELVELEKEAEELDALILKEDNERRINELYRNVMNTKSKLDSLNVRRSNYSACFNLLDLIYINAREIVIAGDFSYKDYSLAKAVLNISKLRDVLGDPDKALAILKKINKDIAAIAEKTKKIDDKAFVQNNISLSVTDEALAYKEELLRKKIALMDKPETEEKENNNNTEEA